MLFALFAWAFDFIGHSLLSSSLAKSGLVLFLANRFCLRHLEVVQAITHHFRSNHLTTKRLASITAELLRM